MKDIYGYPDYLPRPQSELLRESLAQLFPNAGKVEFKPLVIPENHTEQDLLDYGKMQEIATNQCHQYNNQLEKQVREKLEAAGHNFECGSALVHFLKTRCQLIKDQNQLVTMFVDGKHFTQWYDTIDVKMDWSNPLKIKATLTHGLPPEINVLR